MAAIQTICKKFIVGSSSEAQIISNDFAFVLGTSLIHIKAPNECHFGEL